LKRKHQENGEVEGKEKPRGKKSQGERKAMGKEKPLERKGIGKEKERGNHLF
jgi:hypothetical protein